MTRFPLGQSETVLADAFNARCCTLCGRPACVVFPGAEAEYRSVTTVTADGGVRKRARLMRREVPDINLCLADAERRWSRSNRLRGGRQGRLTP